MKYIVHGNGIYQYSLLPEKFRVKHGSFGDAESFLPVVAKGMDQSILCFFVSKIEENNNG